MTRPRRGRHTAAAIAIALLAIVTSNLAPHSARAQISRPALLPGRSATSSPADTLHRRPPAARPAGSPAATSEPPAAPTPLTAASLEAHLQQTHWRILTRTSPPTPRHVQAQSLEIKRTLPLSPDLALYPLLTVTLIDYLDTSQIPGALPTTAVQEYSPDAAATHFAGLISPASAWPPTHIEALRKDSQVIVIGSAGYLYAEAAQQLRADLKTLMVAGQSAATTRYSTRHAQLTQSERIAQAQRLLQLMGFYPGPLDNRWGPLSRAAMEAFQATTKLPVTGAADSLSVAALRAEAAHYTP